MKKLLLCLALLLGPAGLTLAGPININTADAQALDAELPGIGRALAQRIIDYRAAHGPFHAPEDLRNVPYIGSKTFEKMRPFVRVDDS